MSDIDIPQRMKKYRGWVQMSRLALDADDLHRPDMTTTSFPATDKKKDHAIDGSPTPSAMSAGRSMR